MAEIETRMRTGKLQFKWRQLRGWCGAQVSASLADDADVELPLATVVPLFLSVRQAPETRKKVEVDSRIPDVFGKSAAPVPSSAPVPAPTPAAAPAPAPAPASPPAPVERPLRLEQTPQPQPTAPQPAADGAEPASIIPGGKSMANQEIGVPGEIIRRIRALDGVSGVFLATGDGLLIAGDVPGTNDNILAAFAPTVFSQMGKYAEMARLGAPAAIELHLTGANVHVRKAGKLFLGVLMPPGCPLPLSEIDRISATLQPHAS
jgi:predicted regulator of Ras-like GTPase activity (Roadblock/LC7/MglB family)